MKNNFFKIMIAVFSLVVINSCQKNKPVLGSAGPNLIRFPYSSPESVNTNPVVDLTGTQTGQIQVNRDVSDPAILNQAETVTLSLDNTIITSYNAANGTSFFPIDPSVYSFDASNPLAGGKITVNFAAGEYIKYIKFSLDLTKVPAGSSAFGIKIESSTLSKVSDGSNKSLVAFIKNPFAGTYSVTGTRYNYTGVVGWNNVLPVPAGFTATTNMANYSPRTATPDDGVTFEIPFGNVGTGYNYVITYNPNGPAIAVDYTFTSVYSNFETTVVSVTPPGPGVKASFHIITHYNNALAAAGNDRIFDETFVQQ